MKDKHKKRMIYIAAVLILLLYGGVIYMVNVQGAMSTQYVKRDNGIRYQNLLLEDQEIYSQTFLCETRNLYGIMVPLDMKKVQKGDMAKVTVKDSKKKELLQKEIPLDTLKKKKLTLTFPERLSNVRQETFLIEIEVLKMDKDSEIYFYTTRKGYYEDGNLKIGETAKKEDICFTQLVSSTDFLRGMAFGGGIFVLVIFTLFYYLICEKKVSLEKWYPAIFMVLAILYSITMTPFSLPDEAAHYYSAYEVSNKLMGQSSKKEGIINMRAEDAQLVGLDEELSKRTYATVVSELGHLQKSDKIMEVEQETVGVPDYFYLPSAIGITLARLLHLDTVWMMYIGRLFNTIAFAVLAYIGLRQIPFSKLMYMVVGISPIVLHQVCGFSYDAVIYGLSFLFIGMVLKLIYQSENVTWKEIAVLAVIGAFFAPSKSGAYLPICFLACLIPAKKFASKKKYLAGIGTALAVPTAAFGVNFIVNSMKTIGTAAQNVVEWTGTAKVTYTISDVIMHPKGFAFILVRTFVEKGDSLIMSTFGSIMGSYNIYMFTPWVVAFIILLLVANLKPEEEEMFLDAKHKIWMGLLVLGSIVLVAVGMFIGWTPNDSGVIEGIQGRYFIPVLPMIMLILRNKTIVIKKEIDRGVIMGAVMINLLMLIYAFGVCVLK